MTANNHLIDARRSALLLVDLQAGLLPVIDGGEQVVETVIKLLGAAVELDVPCVVSEQYPAGLGHSAPAVIDAARSATVVSKMHFSCVADGCLSGTAIDAHEQVVVCGTESHVCVLQTVLDLVHEGKQVFVVADGVGSRTDENKHLALARMRAAGAVIVSAEMVIFEWLKVAGTDVFRRVHRAYLR